MRVLRWSFLFGPWLVAGAVQAQLYSGTAVTPNPSYDGRFTFARLRYAGDGCSTNEGPGWHHDYRVAEQHLMRLMNELTSLDGRADSSVVFSPDDPGLMKYPVAYLSEPGCWTLSESEAKGLQTYLRKGGFLMVDDFSGGDPANLERQIQRVLPDGHLVPIKPSDPIFTLFLGLDAAIVQAQGVDFRGIYEDNDPTKRLMVIANYNVDIGDYWQWSNEGFNPPETNEAYKIGLNYIIYGLSH
jgi:hypothetical protein